MPEAALSRPLATILKLEQRDALRSQGATHAIQHVGVVTLCVYNQKVDDLRQSLTRQKVVHRQLVDRCCPVFGDSVVLWVQYPGILPAEQQVGLRVGGPTLIGHGDIVHRHQVAAVRHVC
eukprot:scaffold75118_cov60-Phaeocystis_antarctica.AAC.2